MNGLSRMSALYDVEHGRDVPLPPALAALYGRLQFPLQAGRPYVLGNFVSTLDGVVTLNTPGQSGGGPISGFNPHDHLVMGLLRAVADAVIVGAGTLRAVPEHRWTAAYIAPSYAEAYQELRTHLGKPEPPLNVIVTARGTVSLDLPVFQSGEVPVLLVTTSQGKAHIRQQRFLPSVQIAAVQHTGVLSAQAIVQAVCRVRQCQVILVEGGPRLLGDFIAEQVLDELFLTLAPQVAGRDASIERPGLVEGHHFAPEHPLSASSSASNAQGVICFCAMRSERVSMTSYLSIEQEGTYGDATTTQLPPHRCWCRQSHERPGPPGPVVHAR